MHCAHCGFGECLRISSDPTALRCSNCGNCDDLAERFSDLETKHAQALERIERLEKVVVSLGFILETGAIRPRDLDQVDIFYSTIRKIRLGFTERNPERASK